MKAGRFEISPATIAAVILTAAPALAVILARSIGPVGPRTAGAATFTETKAASLAEWSPKPPSEAQLKARAAAEQSLTEGFGMSPLRVPPVIAVAPRVETPASPPIPAESLALTSIMSTAHGPSAVISGKIRHLGDTVMVNWTIQSIDPATSTVTISGPDGKQATLRIPVRHTGK